MKFLSEAVATGTFIYVTFLELVPHEFMGDVEKGPLKPGIKQSTYFFSKYLKGDFLFCFKKKHSLKFDPISLVLVMALGFATMAGFQDSDINFHIQRVLTFVAFSNVQKPGNQRIDCTIRVNLTNNFRPLNYRL